MAVVNADCCRFNSEAQPNWFLTFDQGRGVGGGGNDKAQGRGGLAKIKHLPVGISYCLGLCVLCRFSSEPGKSTSTILSAYPSF